MTWIVSAPSMLEETRFDAYNTVYERFLTNSQHWRGEKKTIHNFNNIEVAKRNLSQTSQVVCTRFHCSLVLLISQNCKNNDDDRRQRRRQWLQRRQLLRRRTTKTATTDDGRRRRRRRRRRTTTSDDDGRRRATTTTATTAKPTTYNDGTHTKRSQRSTKLSSPDPTKSPLQHWRVENHPRAQAFIYPDPE